MEETASGIRAAIKSTDSGLGSGEIMDVAPSGSLSRLLSNLWPCKTASGALTV